MTQKKQIDALIDSVGLDAIVQHEEVLKAFKPAMIGAARIALQEHEEAKKPKWMTRKEAMDVLGVSLSTIYRMQKEGLLRVNTDEAQLPKLYFRKDVEKIMAQKSKFGA